METDRAERVLTEAEAFATLNRILIEEFGREAKDVTPLASFRGDLDFDSLEIAELVLQLEQAFACEIPDDDLPKIATVQNAVSYALAHS